MDRPPRVAGPRRLLSDARAVAARLLGALERHPSALRLAVVSDVRRWAPTVDRVELLATAHEPAALADAFAALPLLRDVSRPGPREVAAVHEDGLPVRLEVVDGEGEFHPRAFVLTGSRTFVEAALAGGRRPVGRTEEEVFRSLGLGPRPPELRERALLDEPVPDDLLTVRDVRGVLHVRTSAGGGRHSFGELATRAAREGFAWIAATDRDAAAPPGETPQDAAEAVAAVEVGVRADGSLSMPDAALEPFDVVVAVLDVEGADPRRDVTDRLRRAAAHPRVHVLGRPTGRLLLERDGPPIDVARVLDACAEHGTAVEISGDPRRLDLPEEWHAEARRRGVRAAVAADAYDLVGVEQVIYAVGCARRGGWRRGEVLTTMEAAELRETCRAKSARGGR